MLLKSVYINISHYDTFGFIHLFIPFCIFLLTSSFMLGLWSTNPIVNVEFPVTILHQIASSQFASLFIFISYARIYYLIYKMIPRPILPIKSLLNITYLVSPNSAYFVFIGPRFGYTNVTVNICLIPFSYLLCSLHLNTRILTSISNVFRTFCYWFV